MALATFRYFSSVCTSITKPQEFKNPEALKEKGAILNWFDVTAPEGYFSINDKLSEIFESKRAKLVVALFGLKLLKKMK